MSKRKYDSTAARVARYVAIIEDDIPLPTRARTAYPFRLYPGDLIELAALIQPMQSVVLPVGSMGRLSKLLKDTRGLRTVSQCAQEDPTGRIWVLPPDVHAEDVSKGPKSSAPSLLRKANEHLQKQAAPRGSRAVLAR